VAVLPIDGDPNGAKVALPGTFSVFCVELRRNKGERFMFWVRARLWVEARDAVKKKYGNELVSIVLDEFATRHVNVDDPDVFDLDGMPS